jgi:hypothetical protein
MPRTSRSASRTPSGDVPIARINARYRIVYLNFGHGDRIYSTTTLPTIVDNSVRYLLGSSRVNVP